MYLIHVPDKYVYVFFCFFYVAVFSFYFLIIVYIFNYRKCTNTKLHCRYVWSIPFFLRRSVLKKKKEKKKIIKTAAPTTVHLFTGFVLGLFLLVMTTSDLKGYL